MVFGTSTTDFVIPESDATSEKPPRITPSLKPSSNTVAADFPKIQQTSSTNLLPETILTNWGGIARANMSVRMYDDLVRLASAPDGWRGPGSRALQSVSLMNFLEFWLLVRKAAKEPEFALAPDGSLQAVWHDSIRKRLDLRFSDSNVFYGLFANNTIHEGVDRAEAVAQILKLHRSKPLLWSAR